LILLVGLLTRKNRRPYNLYYVGADVKQSMILSIQLTTAPTGLVIFILHQTCSELIDWLIIFIYSNMV